MHQSFAAAAAALVVMAFGTTPASAQTAPTIKVVTWLAPNVFGSPSYSTWEANAVNGLKTGNVVSTGTPGTPGYAFQQANIARADMIVTDFPSWKATLHPETAFGPAYANEYGTRAYFGLIVNGNGAQFSIDNLSFIDTSNDSANYFGSPVPVTNFGYDSGFVGVLKGADGQLFTGDDIYVTGGDSDQLVDGLIGAGIGAGENPCLGNPHEGACNTDPERQAAINDDLNQLYVGSPGAYSRINWPTRYTGTYTLDRATGTGTFAIGAAVPEPATWGMLIFGFGVVGLTLRGRRSVTPRLA